MHPYLRQALMRYHNEFFAMTEEEQAVWKLTDKEHLDKKIRKFIKKKVRKRGKLNPAQILEKNSILLPYQGIGPNDFMMNEFDWNEKILRFKNLYEYNENNHEYQEECNLRDFSEYVTKPLFNRFSSWARANVNGKFNYLNLNSYQIWLYYDADNNSFDWLDKNIPYDFVPGKDNGKKVRGGYLWDMNLDAGGLEGYHEHMSTFSREWTNAKYDEDCAADAFGDVVFVIDNTEDKLDPSLDYIFGSTAVLKHLTFMNFIDDCEKVHGDSAKLLELKEARKVEFYEAMDTEFAKIKLKPSSEYESRADIKKKRSVTIADGALDDLEE